MIRLCGWSRTTAYVYFVRANARAELSQHAEAIFDYDQTLRLQPYFVGAYVNRAQSRIELGQFQKAMADYEQAARLIPEIPHVYFNRSLAKADMGLYREALADLKTALVFARRAGDSEFIARIEKKIQEFEQG